VTTYFPFDWAALVDVIAVAALLWALLVWLRRARARIAFVGVAIAGGAYLLARLASLELTAWVFQGFFAVLVIILVVVFQDDLRRLFEAIAVYGLRRRPALPATGAVDVLVRASARLAETHTGALIVVPGREPLERHLEGGIGLDGRLSEPLLLSLFDTSSPGHDGAVLLAGDRIQRFAVHLPLSTDRAELGPRGTRHAAGLGLSERTDALCIIVSEERGTITVAQEGHLRVLEPAELATELQRFLERAAEAVPGQTGWHVARYWREGLLAVALASALWALRVPGSSVVEVVRVAPVVVDKLPEGYELESVKPAEVEVTLRGLRRDLFLRATDPPVVHIDALLAQLGRRTFQVTPERVSAPRGVEVVAVSPTEVRLSLTEVEAPSSR
jgi:DNA integrity scanning protein DisA with diadenylate cyclase activity